MDRNYTKIPNELLEKLTKIYLSNYEMRFLLFLLRYTNGFNKKLVKISLKFISEATGIPLPHVSRTKKKLALKQIVTQTGKKLGINYDFLGWKVTQIGKLPKQVTKVTQIGNKKLPKQVTNTSKIHESNGKIKNPKENYINKYNNININYVNVNDKVYGRPEVNLVLDAFKREMGKVPVDKYPRQVAWNFARNIISAYKKATGKKPSEEKFAEILAWCFRQYKKKDFWEKTEKLETVRLHSKAKLEELLLGLEKEGKNGQTNQP